jgi:hypothetical protein
VKVSAQVIRSLVRGITDLDRKIEEAAAAHPDFFIFESLPGAGCARSCGNLRFVSQRLDRSPL